MILRVGALLLDCGASTNDVETSMHTLARVAGLPANGHSRACLGVVGPRLGGEPITVFRVVRQRSTDLAQLIPSGSRTDKDTPTRRYPIAGCGSAHGPVAQLHRPRARVSNGALPLLNRLKYAAGQASMAHIVGGAPAAIQLASNRIHEVGSARPRRDWIHDTHGMTGHACGTHGAR